jgi:hypothetical protein
MPTPRPDISTEDFCLAAHRAWWPFSDKDLECMPTPLLTAIWRAHLDLILDEKENSK